jgi:uncharacterized surface protein with fasciclin (FAS1) repeats
MKLPLTFALVAALTAGSIVIAQQANMTPQNPMVGGMAMSPQKNIVQNAMNSKDHTTLVAAVKAAGLADALMADGPFTVFAPTNDAFNALPHGTVDNLLKPENKTMLQGVLTYHVAKGKWTMKDIAKAIRDGNGKAEITTLSGGKLWAMWNGPTNIVIKDEAGGIASISTYDVMQSNGVIHVVTRVLMPKM